MAKKLQDHLAEYMLQMDRADRASAAHDAATSLLAVLELVNKSSIPEGHLPGFSIAISTLNRIVAEFRTIDYKRKWNSIRETLFETIEDLDEADKMKESQPAQEARAASPTTDPRSVFVVHGRNAKAKAAMFDFLNALKLDPLDWEEAVKLTGKSTPHTIEVINAAMKTAQAIVVLVTPDETVQLNPEFVSAKDKPHEKEPSEQARPNVYYELGMAVALYQERTIIVELGDVRPFSDIDGVNVIRMSDSSDSRNALADRLETAKCDVKKKGAHWLRAGSFDASVKSAIPRELTGTQRAPVKLVSHHGAAVAGDLWPTSFPKSAYRHS
jgi:predicted nucleotide-binding protein